MCVNVMVSIFIHIHVILSCSEVIVVVEFIFTIPRGEVLDE